MRVTEPCTKIAANKRRLRAVRPHARQQIAERLERNGRVLVDLLPEGPRELREDEATASACIVGDALAASDADLINLNGNLLLIRDGVPVQVTQPALLDLIDQYLGMPPSGRSRRC
jgi:hypothetical protein